MLYAVERCAVTEVRALCLPMNALCRSTALLLKCLLIVYIWPEKVNYSYMNSKNKLWECKLPIGVAKFHIKGAPVTSEVYKVTPLGAPICPAQKSTWGHGIRVCSVQQSTWSHWASVAVSALRSNRPGVTAYVSIPCCNRPGDVDR